jgi:hypothetical protein
MNPEVDVIRARIEEFATWLHSQLNNSAILNDKTVYYRFVEEKRQYLVNLVEDSESQDLKSQIYFLIGGMSRFFEEFNWNESPEYYRRCKEFLNELTELSNHLL